MHIDEYRVLMRRSQGFLDEARDALGKGRFGIACFLAEQAAQIFSEGFWGFKLLFKTVGEHVCLGNGGF